ncbi:hypothetical protein [Pseudomonas nitroreducens]|uniref:hypothetical protein n=1 Tax=Pseudomonas nitroreducens TaxID=46680 RepID=UPI0026584405|nr:hypothetical protein [Pseudomonas nitroreducens]MCP1646971.1 hypothetical protein [Pseudomonas nitroreducens]MCP1685547.1 hypothetical protein [Pseudomonas nitroreducens]
MQTAQHANKAPCLVLLHPAAATSRAAVEAIQAKTGLLVIVTTSRCARLAKPNHSDETDLGPWGGAA